jgi:hypothetical protein
MTARSDVLFITDKTKLLKLGQSRRSDHGPDTSELLHRSKEPRYSIFNHLVGLSKQQRRHIGAEHLYVLEVDG